MLKKYFFVVLFFTSIINCQPIKVYLNTLTKLEDNFVHMVIPSNTPKEKLIMPKLAANEVSLPKKFLDLFYSWDTDLDHEISILLYQLKNEDLLYVDKNNDNDLSNDGAPILFPLNKDSVNVEVVSPKDKDQRLRLSIHRRPYVPDSIQSKYVDKEGNIIPKFLPLAKFYSDDFEFEGKKRSFYFDDVITLRKGELHLGSSTYLVGLFDYSNNGRYSDERDLFLIDLDKTGKLNLDVDSKVFSINDVFTIEGKNYKLTEVDKYGKYVIINETKEEPANLYLKWRQGNLQKSIEKESSKEHNKQMLDNDFWTTKLVTLDGKEMDLSSFKGKYLFINIWGEWCQPCINEIEELKQGYEKYKSQVAFLGIMKVGDLEIAKKLISDKKMLWENTFITDSIEKRFGVKGYPTNILIFPDGATYIKTHGINRTFFDMNVK